MSMDRLLPATPGEKKKFKKIFFFFVSGIKNLQINYSKDSDIPKNIDSTLEGIYHMGCAFIYLSIY